MFAALAEILAVEAALLFREAAVRAGCPFDAGGRRHPASNAGFFQQDGDLLDALLQLALLFVLEEKGEEEERGEESEGEDASNRNWGEGGGQYLRQVGKWWQQTNAAMKCLDPEA